MAGTTEHDHKQPRSLFELSIDNAFIRFTERLFETFVADLEHEGNTPTSNRREGPSAREKLKSRYDRAIAAHDYMIDMMQEKRNG